MRGLSSNRSRYSSSLPGGARRCGISIFPDAARTRHTTTLDDDANANANARTNERTSERTANERRTTWRSRRRCDASANARTNATRTRRCAKMRIRCPEGLTADARRRRWRETPIAFFVTSSETPTTCVRGRARGGGEGEERARVLRFDVSSRLVSSRLVSSARAREKRCAIFPFTEKT